jgi:hypothetical protein
MQVWKNSLKKYKIGAYKHSKHKYYLSSQINSLEREYSFTYKTDEDVFRVKGKEYALTEENRKILLDKIVEFENEWSNAFREYENVFVNGCSDIYIKKLNKTRYHVFWLEDEELISFKGHMLIFLAEFLARFYKLYSYTTKKEDVGKKVYDNIITDFLSLKDQYVIKLAKFITNQATKEDVEFINEYENADYRRARHSPVRACPLLDSGAHSAQRLHDLQLREEYDAIHVPSSPGTPARASCLD